MTEMGLALPRGGCLPYGGRIDFAARSTCRSVEILRYPMRPDPVRPKEEELNDMSLPAWFNKDLTLPPLSSGANQAPTGGLRLLFGTCDFDPKESFPSLSFKKESFTMIGEELGLPREYLKCLAGESTQAFKFSKPRSGKEALSCFVFKLASYRPCFYQLALSYDMETGLTHGLILTKSHNNESVVPGLLSGLQSLEMYCEQPSLLTVIATEQVIDNCNGRICELDEKLGNLEETMGQHEYEDRPKGNPLEIDFLSTTSALNHISKRLAVDVLRLSTIQVALEKISQWKKEIADSQNLPKQAEGIGLTKEQSHGFRIIDEKIAYLTNHCRVLGLRGEYEEKRTRSLIQVVYQFMAQRDAKVNIELAKSSAILAIESKKDSSAMKTISILGMLFLPGTFVAAIFALPVFNWDNDNTLIVKDSFKYYWFVAIPLTLAVFVVWTIAMLLRRAWLSQTRSRSGDLEAGVELTYISSW